MDRRIKVLDEKTINKIAAGEVIERPSSVIKELVENSIDAGSTSITIEIKNGGKDYIRVTDNGTGINEDDIELALLRHSTSKISNVEDLNSIYSLGFRGEALASISSVSMLTLISKTKDSLKGKQIEINGGNIIKNQFVGCPIGTTIIVSNLFYNVPVRKKFLKSENVESSHISDIINRLSLSFPNISFKFIRDNKVILFTPGNNKLISAIYSIFGKDTSSSLYEVNFTKSKIKISGYISKTSYTRGNRSYQFLFINKRMVTDKKITNTIEEAYKTLIPINRFPIFFLFLEIEPESVDVNVHPTKTEVRFSNEEVIQEIIYASIKAVLNENNLIPEVKIYENKKTNDDIKQDNFIDYISDEIQKDNKNNITLSDNKTIYNDYVKEKIVVKEEGIDFNLDKVDSIKNTYEKKQNYTTSNGKIENKIPEFKIIGRLFSTYILAEGIQDSSFYFIDQHAAHERVTYEKYKMQYDNEDIASQKLMVPEVINLTNAEIELIKNYLETFKRLGFEIDEFGINSVILRSVPLIFGKPDPTIFIDILDNIKSNLTSNYDMNVEKIMKLACTNSIKGGDNISDMEIDSLLKSLSKCENPYTCPHGRPIIIKMTQYEIEKKFKRIQ